MRMLLEAFFALSSSQGFKLCEGIFALCSDLFSSYASFLVSQLAQWPCSHNRGGFLTEPSLFLVSVSVKGWNRSWFDFTAAVSAAGLMTDADVN